MNDSEKALKSVIDELPVLDAHEHLPPERFRLEKNVDVFTLFSGYSGGDLRSAGFGGADAAAVRDASLPVRRRFRIFKPYYERIRHGGYARAAQITAEKLFGIAEISEETCEELTEAIQKNNTPGLYDRIFKRCNIKCALTQCGRTETGNAKILPLMPLPFFSERPTSFQSLARPVVDAGAMRAIPEAADSRMVYPAFLEHTHINTLDDYLAAVYGYMRRSCDGGAVGFKTATKHTGAPDRAEALRCFEKLRDGSVQSYPDSNPIKDYVTNCAVSFAEELDVPVAMHAGYWGDFRELAPSHLIPLLIRHPKARFDLYHLGFPYVREALMLGKTYPNVCLNFCWIHIISPTVARAALSEALDLIPINKIIGFGGDYVLAAEKIVGHLEIARENIAGALAERIRAGRMSENQAVDTARLWLYNNAVDLYNLHEQEGRE